MFNGRYIIIIWKKRREMTFKGVCDVLQVGKRSFSPRCFVLKGKCVGRAVRSKFQQTSRQRRHDRPAACVHRILPHRRPQSRNGGVGEICAL